MLGAAPARSERLVGVALVCADVPPLAGKRQDSMSGICAVLMNEHSVRINETLTAVAAGLSPEAETAVSVKTVIGPMAGLGVARRFGGQQIYSNSRICVVCDADLY